jgi:hypothetical protein
MGDMEDNKRANIKVMERVSDIELNRLMECLKKIEGFEFLVNCQLIISKT